MLQGGSAEVELKKGNSIRLTTDKSIAEKGTDSDIYVDYINITKVVKPGDHIFVDDGLISLVVKQVGLYTSFKYSKITQLLNIVNAFFYLYIVLFLWSLSVLNFFLYTVNVEVKWDSIVPCRIFLE